MSRSVALVTQSLSKICLSRGIHSFHAPASSSVYIPSIRREKVVPTIDLPQSSNAVGHVPTASYELPALENVRRVYTFPTFDKAPISAPAPFLQDLIEKMDPIPEKPPIEAPPVVPPVAIQLAPRLLTIRRKKMKKHKRRKRFDRDYFKYQKYHREKKLKAEREFIRRMKAHLAELESFDPEKYVEETIAAAKKEWSDELAPTGRKRYPHWSRLMSLEELYGIPKSDYIDKNAGLPGEEDAEKIRKLKVEYDNKYRGI
ncbi:hypothetical protein NECAME_13705 [Necator americanus]|uniref:Mitochondrial mRNA-processing protein COX24 C-terminal domain-containing protein n=1 Tax=Necator americanus TaxID=51031 RepID=W2SVZ5_NECAM|nr:hypothetical protein NECAME_13705 [Necator americanus]ETN72867.1 hypothetical protein NECAME_13705 [Necator americanus]